MLFCLPGFKFQRPWATELTIYSFALHWLLPFQDEYCAFYPLSQAPFNICFQESQAKKTKELTELRQITQSCTEACRLSCPTVPFPVPPSLFPPWDLADLGLSDSSRF